MIRIEYSDQLQAEGIKSLVYGTSGIGKTPLLATLPSGIILSAEKGLLSIRRLHVPVIQINNYAEMKEAMAWAYQSHEARQYYSFGLDSASEIAEMVLQNALKKNKDPRKAYGELATEMIMIAKYFRDIPGKSTVLIAKEEYDKDEVTGITRFQPQFPGQKLGPAMPYFFDETLRMVQVNGYTAIATQLNFNQFARDRSGNLAQYEPPDLNLLFRKILGV